VTHVGIYVGQGRMIDAPAPGLFVREESINTPYWQEHLAGYGRVPGIQTEQVAQSRPDERSEEGRG
jgi:hypothetical protein